MAEKKEIKEIIEIPDDIDVTVGQNNFVTVKGGKGELSRNFLHPDIKIIRKDNSMEISCKNSRKRNIAFVGTCVAHIKNMFKGVTDGFEYTMKVVYSHFPIKTEVKNNNFLINNFLGERTPRIAKILDGVNVEIKGETIHVRGIDIEKVGQTVSNIERATKVKNRDIRVFQDGIYRISKGR